MEKLSALERREIELTENLARKDMEWPEQVALVKAIDDMKKEKHGDAEVDKTKKGWSKRQTAALLNRGTSQVASDIALAEAMEDIPELAQCKTKDEAQKTLRTMVEKLALRELHKRKVENALNDTEKQLYKRASNSYRVGDCIAGMKEMGTDSPKFIIAEVDPPYGIDLGKVKKGGTDKTYNEISKDKYPQFLREVSGEVYRVLAPDAWCVWWYGPTWHHLVLTTLRSVGFDVDEIPAIWIKPTGQTNLPDRKFAKGWEPFFLCRKGNPLIHKRGRLNVFDYTPISHQKKIHDTERPLPLIAEILNVLCVPGVGSVLIPFLGSGNTLLAAYEHGMQGVGWDIEGADTQLRFIDRVIANHTKE